jgi:hypothetical protein
MAEPASLRRNLSPSAVAAPSASATPQASGITMAPRNLIPLGQILLEDGAVEAGDLLKAVVMRQRQDARLGEILLAHGWVTETALMRALSRQWRVALLDPGRTAGDPRLVDALGAEFCLRHALLPWRQIGGVTWIATARPEAFADLLADLPADFGAVRMLICSETQIHQAILSQRRASLIRKAEQGVPEHLSCRSRRSTSLPLLLIAAALALGLFWQPGVVLAGLTLWAALSLLGQSVLKLLALRLSIRDANAPHPAPTEMQGPLPAISVMVPLFQEKDIANKLVGRLARIDYPRELTDILLVIEATDKITVDALASVSLPNWIRVIEVPPGSVRTKPRAMNYALSFCRGQVVGVWDAEDRPEPDQLYKVARRFDAAAPDVACLQGALDYYNPRSNWLARCFTIEYASWFRVLLPGVARLGLAVPLGGTTVFFRRDVLERVGAWDAWNVTEDADLGVRLARLGWRTEILDSTTDEEANCRALPWIKQRSRWLKGYAMTWAVHMRKPVALWRDLGPRAFLGFQIQFLGALSQYLLAPLLWSFWLLSLGFSHPLNLAGSTTTSLLFGLFVASEAVSIAIGLWAVSGSKHRHLMPWVPSLHLYFPLGCLAGWKAIYEVIVKPFYWDKTAHGIFEDADQQIPGTQGALATIELLGQIGDGARAMALPPQARDDLPGMAGERVAGARRAVG